jgi:hypothetical protein
MLAVSDFRSVRLYIVNRRPITVPSKHGMESLHLPYLQEAPLSQNAPEPDPGAHDTFGSGFSPGQQHASGWGNHSTDWSTAANASGADKSHAEASYNAAQQFENVDPSFSLSELQSTLPHVSDYGAEHPAPQYLSQPSASAAPQYSSGPVEPKKGEDHLPALFSMDPPATPPPDNQPPSYMSPPYSQFNQPQQLPPTDEPAQSSRPASSIAAAAQSSPAQPPSQPANLPEQLSQAPPQSQPPVVRPPPSQPQIDSMPPQQPQPQGQGQRGGPYESSYVADLHTTNPPGFLSEPQNGPNFGGQQAAVAPQQQPPSPQAVQQLVPASSQQPQQQQQQQQAVPLHLGQPTQAQSQGVTEQQAGSQVPSQLQGLAPQHVPSSAVELDMGMGMRHEKGPDGSDMGQQQMMGQFSAQLPEMHNWNSMQPAEMYGGMRSGAPAMNPSMAGMMPALQPGMPPNPQVRLSEAFSR